MPKSIEVKSQSLFESKYQKLNTVGKGNFGKVYLVEERTTKQKFAAKVVDKKVFKSGDQKQHARREQLICETFSKGLGHKNIVQVHEVIPEDDSIYIIMEYVECGELFDKIRQSRGLPEPCARKWFREIIEAVQYIHSNNIVHRDLKPENVLIDISNNIKLCDFGFGNVIKEGHEVLNTYCGSPFYASPEMVTATPYRGPPADIWSCGVILYAMLTGSLPFQSDEMPQLFQKISRVQYTIPSYVTAEASDLIQKLLCKDARERISAEECLLHPWLKPPTIQHAGFTSSQLTVNSQFSFPRKKVGTLSVNSVSTELTEKKQYLFIEKIAEDNKEYEDVKLKSSRFFTRLFRKKSQIAPAVPTKLDNNSHHSSEKKVTKSKFLFSKFTGLFKTSLQRRIADK